MGAEDPARAGAEPELTTQLLRRFAAGDLLGLDGVVRRLAPLLLATARHRLGPDLRSLYDPEDLVAEAWTVTLPRLPGLLTGGGRLTPVLLKFLSTTMLHRINRLLERHVFGKPGRAGGDASEALGGIADSATGVVSRAVRGERQHALTTAIEAMAPIDRQVLLLRGVEQLPNAAVARELGLEPGTVAVRYHRALQRLREQLPDSVVAELSAPAD